MKHIQALFLTFCLSLVSIQTWACATARLVQSAPSETDLAVPGITFAQDEWVKLIDESRVSIDIEQMYMDAEPGHAMDPVIDALKRAAQRGVKIRFILAKQMMRVSQVHMERISKEIPQIEFRIIDLGSLTGGIQHAKFFIFDQRTIFVGSQNADWKALSEILETGVVAQDPTVVGQLQAIFNLDWVIAGTGKVPTDLGVAPATAPNSDLKLVAAPASLNPKNIDSMFGELKKLLGEAKKKVRITLLDISSFKRGQSGEWLELIDLIESTAQRGVKIEFLVSHWNTEKPEVATLRRLAGIPNVEVKVATVPEKSTGSIPFARVNHSKMMVIDDSVLWVGTSNWDYGYFMNTRGIELIIRRGKMVAQGHEIFDRLWVAPYTVAFDVNRDYPKPRK